MMYEKDCLIIILDILSILPSTNHGILKCIRYLKPKQKLLNLKNILNHIQVEPLLLKDCCRPRLRSQGATPGEPIVKADQ